LRCSQQAAFGVDVVVGPPAVRGDDPFEIAAEQFFEAVAVAVFGDPEDRGLGCGCRPERASLGLGEPAGLINVDDRRLEHLLDQFFVWESQRG